MTAYRSRRTNTEMEAIRDSIVAVAREDQPVTVRQVFYRLVSEGVIDKTENEYKSTVIRLIGELRLSGDLPWPWIADNTRWVRKPRTFRGVEDALTQTAELYRRRLWDDLDTYVEVWLEKEALAGVLVYVTDEWDVPLMVTRGYPSLTFLHTAGESFPTDRRTVVYYFGDHDPSGVDIARNTEARLREFASDDADIEFHRLAVTAEQIVEWALPTRPTKRTDTRARDWIGGSVEVDAIPPRILRDMCNNAIVGHFDIDRLRVTLEAEQSERDILIAMRQFAGEV